jgi:Flagellar biosynthesis protein, FliO
MNRYAGREEAREDAREEGREKLARNPSARAVPIGGLAAWLLARLRRAPRPRPRLTLLERIALAPRQSLALVEAEGRHLLVVTSAEGGSAFYPLDGPHSSPRRTDDSAIQVKRSPRVSW